MTPCATARIRMIRTPLNAIIGLNNIAMSEPSAGDKVKEYLEKIGNSANHLLGIINDILDMSRIESGRMVIRSEEFGKKNEAPAAGTADLKGRRVLLAEDMPVNA